MLISKDYYATKAVAGTLGLSVPPIVNYILVNKSVMTYIVLQFGAKFTYAYGAKEPLGKKKWRLKEGNG